MTTFLQRSALALTVVLACAACAGSPAVQAPVARTPQSVVAELLATDRSFSQASAKTDLVSGLAAMFASDVTMPLPTGQFAESARQASEALRSNPEQAKSRIEWVPIRGGVSADGQHGFTFGYMTMTGPEGTRTPLTYLSYWVKRPEGWRVVAYKRGRRSEGEVSLTLMAPALPAVVVRPSTDPASIERFRTSLDQAERAFSDAAQRVGLGTAFAQFGTPDAVNMGGPAAPGFVVGAEAIGRGIGAGGPGNPSPVSWAPDRVIVASSGDLGVTIGMIRRNAPVSNGERAAVPFFTVWRRASPNDPWRYIAE